MQLSFEAPQCGSVKDERKLLRGVLMEVYEGVSSFSKPQKNLHVKIELRRQTRRKFPKYSTPVAFFKHEAMLFWWFPSSRVKNIIKPHLNTCLSQYEFAYTTAITLRRRCVKPLKSTIDRWRLCWPELSGEVPRSNQPRSSRWPP